MLLDVSNMPLSYLLNNLVSVRLDKIMTCAYIRQIISPTRCVIFPTIRSMGSVELERLIDLR